METRRYKFITIRRGDEDEVFEKHPVYRIYANRGGDQLGIVSWYRPWKEYVFSSKEDCVFNNSRLRDVLDFIETVIPNFSHSTNAEEVR